MQFVVSVGYVLPGGCIAYLGYAGVLLVDGVVPISCDCIIGSYAHPNESLGDVVHTLIATTIANALAPRWALTVSEWADAERYLKRKRSNHEI